MKEVPLVSTAVHLEALCGIISSLTKQTFTEIPTTSHTTLRLPCLKGSALSFADPTFLLLEFLKAMISSLVLLLVMFCSLIQSLKVQQSLLHPHSKSQQREIASSFPTHPHSALLLGLCSLNNTLKASLIYQNINKHPNAVMMMIMMIMSIDEMIKPMMDISSFMMIMMK